MYYKTEQDGFIIAIGQSVQCENEITAEEYNRIKAVLKTRPSREGYEYKLRSDLTWEETPCEQSESDDEISVEEALNILLGVIE